MSKYHRKTEYGGLSVPQTPPNSNRHSWHTAYCRELIDMYRIVQNVMDERYQGKEVEWDSQDKFNKFSQLIYHCSSKNISPHLRKPLEF